MVTTNITDEYLEHQANFQEKYGNKTVVCMQVGSFYELYAVTPEQYEFLRGLTNLLGIVITRKNKKNAVVGEKVTNGNPYMAGFNEASFTKFMKLIVTHGYTVVRIDQEAKVPGKTDKLARNVTKIYSASTCVDDIAGINDQADQYLAVLYLEEYPSDELAEIRRYSVGVTLLDLTTGKSLLFEFHDTNQKNTSHKAGILGNVYSILYNYQPVEVVVYHCSETEQGVSDWINRLNYQPDTTHRRGQLDPKWNNISYQTDNLRKYYQGCGCLQPHDYLNLERMGHATVSLLMAIEFSREHDPEIVANLPKPKVYQPDEYLEVSHQTLETLDVISNRRNQKSLWDILNKCSTALGRRELRDRLIKPITNPSELETRYCQISAMLPHYPEFELKLKDIYDLERLYRRMNLGSLRPSEIGLVLESQAKTVEMWNMVVENPELSEFICLVSDTTDDMIAGLSQFKREIETTFIVEELVSYHQLTEIETSIFQPSVEPEIDSLEQERGTLINLLDEFRHSLCLLSCSEKDQKSIPGEGVGSATQRIQQIVDVKVRSRIDGYVKLVNNEREGYSFKTTKARYREYQRQIQLNPSGLTDALRSLEFRERASEYSIRGQCLTSMSNRLTLVVDRLRRATREAFVNKIKQWYHSYVDVFNHNAKWVGAIDVVKSIAKTSRKYGYVRPVLLEGDGPGKIEATAVRHPIVEQVYQDILFVPNDIGQTDPPEESDPGGVVITGLNGVGKSIYIKSVALSVIMAQAGFFVAASSFSYRPYRSLLTRIGNADNLYKGQSTFYSEMLELDYIIRTSDHRTLVIADELCSGSEYHSAQAILAETIKELVKLKSTFYLTTHFHQCLELPAIQSLRDTNQLLFYHFSVDFSPSDGTLVYHRKLIPGIGEKLYGVEVAKFLLDKKSFVDQCFTTRQQLLQGASSESESELVVSRYNSKLVGVHCEICQKTKSYPGELHTHHIQEQHTANSDGLIGHIHKNNKSNLVILCSRHHRMVHNGEILIKGWTDSPSLGRQLDWSEVS